MQAFSELNLIGVGIRHDHHTNSKNFANSLLVEANLALLDTKLLVHAGNSVYFDIPEGLRWHAAGSRDILQKHAIFGHFSYIFADAWHPGANLATFATKLLVHVYNSVDFDIPEGLRWHAAGSRGTCQKHAIFGHFHTFSRIHGKLEPI